MISKSERILNLMARLLSGSGPVSYEEIRCSVHGYQDGSQEAIRKRFARDKRTLREMGVVLQVSGGDLGGYQIDKRCLLLNELQLSPQLSRLLSLVSRHCPVEPGSTLEANLQSALLKLQRSSTLTSGDVPTAQLSKLTRRPQGYGAVYDLLSEALLQGAAVRIDYQGREGERTKRRVDPYGLGYVHGQWYLVGHCHLRDAQRTFRLSRIVGLPKPIRGAEGHVDVPAEFSLEAALDTLRRQRIEPDDDGPLPVRVAFDDDVFWIARRQVRPDACTPLPDGGGEIRFADADPDRLLGWLEPFGQHATILEPASLLERRAELRASVAERHAGEPQLRPTRGASGPDRNANTPDIARLQRILSLIPFLTRHQGIHVDELAKLIGVPVEELLEDLNGILMCGLPPYLPNDYIGVYVDNGAITMRWADHFVAPVRFNLTEALALRLALQRVFGDSDDDSHGLASRLKESLDSVLPDEMAYHLDALAERIQVSPAAPSAISEPMLAALATRMKLDAEYYAVSSRELTRRRLRPLGLTEHAGALYLTAYCELRQDVRSFHTGRFRRMELVHETFEWEGPIPDQTPSATPPQQAVVRFDKSAIDEVKDAFADETIKLERDGSAVVEVPLYSERWITTWLLSFGDRFEVLEPASLRLQLSKL